LAARAAVAAEPAVRRVRGLDHAAVAARLFTRRARFRALALRADEGGGASGAARAAVGAVGREVLTTGGAAGEPARALAMTGHARQALRARIPARAAVLNVRLRVHARPVAARKPYCAGRRRAARATAPAKRRAPSKTRAATTGRIVVPSIGGAAGDQQQPTRNRHHTSLRAHTRGVRKSSRLRKHDQRSTLRKSLQRGTICQISALSNETFVPSGTGFTFLSQRLTLRTQGQASESTATAVWLGPLPRLVLARAWPARGVQVLLGATGPAGWSRGSLLLAPIVICSSKIHMSFRAGAPASASRWSTTSGTLRDRWCRCCRDRYQ
jgi:hypothetical protein